MAMNKGLAAYIANKKAQSGLPTVGSATPTTLVQIPALKATASAPLTTGKSGSNKSTKVKKHSDGKGHQRITTTKM